MTGLTADTLNLPRVGYITVGHEGDKLSFCGWFSGYDGRQIDRGIKWARLKA